MEGCRALLIMDSFRTYLTAVKKLEEINIVPVIIPGGCTSKVQPLDVSLNKPFKSFVQKKWSDYVFTLPEKKIQSSSHLAKKTLPSGFHFPLSEQLQV